MRKSPPRWADRFLQWYCRPDLLEEIQGDVHELFERDVRENESHARLRFVWNVMRYFRWKNIRKQKSDYQSSFMTRGMLKSFLKTGWRNIVQRRAFSLINVIGLAIGLTSFLLIASFVYDELIYDQYPEQAKNIYRVGLQLEQNGGIDDYPQVDVAVGGGIKSNYPEVKSFLRMTGKFSEFVRRGDVNLKEESIIMADSNILTFFSIPMLEGNAENALDEPGSIVISKAFAQKYFGDKSALGEMLTLHNNGLMKVTGVFEGIPQHSHFHADAFISMASSPVNKIRQTWSNVGFYTYLQLNEHVSAKSLEEKFPQLIERYVVPEIQEDAGLSLEDATKSVNTWKFYLMPLSKIHLYSHTKYELEANGDINNVYIFGALAIFILLLACINFMNLTTAASAKRAIEIGIRKTLGSIRSQLIIQFLAETIILTALASLMAFVTVLILLPVFNQVTGKTIDVSWFFTPQLLLFFFLLFVIVGIGAGLYPAVFLSSFKTLHVLKGSATRGKRSKLRSALVVFQFSISLILIVATIVAYKQLHFLQNIDLGYNKDQILVVDNARILGIHQRAFKQKLTQDHRVKALSYGSVPMGAAGSFGGSEVSAKGNPVSNVHAHFLSVDYDYMNTMGMQLILGRNLSNEFLADSLGENVVINETAMRDLGWTTENVIGSTIVRSATRQNQVVGVVKDFHYTSAKDRIAPMAMMYRAQSSTLLISVQTTELKKFIDDTKALWNSFDTEIPFTYYFLDDRFDQLYTTEQATEKIFIIFMVIAIAIAGLGLYGLSTFSAEQRIKEIAIRKILGSSVGQIVLLQSVEFIYLVLIAIGIGAPIAWWVMSQWLEQFGYRVELQMSVLLLASSAAILIALLTVSFQAFRAAVSNPVKSLKVE